MTFPPIGITGKPTSGKSVFAEVLLKEFNCDVFEASSTLKQAAFVLFDIPPSVYYEDVKTHYVNVYPEDFKGVDLSFADIDDSGKMSYRSLLQVLGTDILTKHCPRVLSDAMARAIREGQHRVVVPGVRSNLEAKVIQSFDGLVVKIVRPSLSSTQGHPIERGISPSLIDVTFTTDSIEELRDHARTFARSLG